MLQINNQGLSLDNLDLDNFSDLEDFHLKILSRSLVNVKYPSESTIIFAHFAPFDVSLR